jgi:hypothetical protein
MIEWIKMLLMAFAAIFAGAVVSAIPPFPQWFAMVDANQAAWLVATGSAALLGFVLMIGGILDVLVTQDRALGHSEAEDVERSVRLAARPVTWRATSYRVWGHAMGREGSEEFSLSAMKQAWRSGAWCRTAVWRRRYVIACGALLMTIGGFSLAFTLTPPPIKVLTGGAVVYVLLMLARGLWRA